MSRLLSLAAGVVPESPPAETVAAAAAAGFGAAGIWVDAAGWTDATTAEVRRRVAQPKSTGARRSSDASSMGLTWNRVMPTSASHANPSATFCGDP